MLTDQAKPVGRYRPGPWPIIAGASILVVTAVLVLGWPVMPEAQFCRRVSKSQLSAIALALETYTTVHGPRPACLEELVVAGLIKREDLFDPRRSDLPELEAKTGHYDPRPDVLYFPAVRADDPHDLVMLCVLFGESPTAKLPAVLNDGRLVELDDQGMINALNRTYRHIGQAIQAAATRPAAGGDTPARTR